MGLEHLVEMPLGKVVVRLDRKELGLEQRGGFEARWATPEDDARFEQVLSPEAYLTTVKAHLQSVYRQQNTRNPSKILLNLASHQLIDDLTGWTKLNAER